MWSQWRVGGRLRDDRSGGRVGQRLERDGVSECAFVDIEGAGHVLLRGNDEPRKIGGGHTQIRPIDMAAAYATFAADGVKRSPHFVFKAVDAQGHVAYQATIKPVSAFDSEQEHSANISRNVTETLLPMYQPRDWFRRGDVLVLEERHWNHDSGRVEAEWTLIRDAEVTVRTSSMRIYSVRKLRALLGAAGFTVEEVLDGSSLEPFALGAPIAIFVAVA